MPEKAGGKRVTRVAAVAAVVGALERRKNEVVGVALVEVGKGIGGAEGAGVLGSESSMGRHRSSKDLVLPVPKCE